MIPLGMWDFLSKSTGVFWVAGVLLLVSSYLSYFYGRKAARHQLAVQYEFEQRRKLRELVGSYHGRLLSAASSLNYRFWNFYKNADAGWLDAHGDYRSGGYYFVSFVHRFLAVCALIRQFESESMYFDARIAHEKDFTFMNYTAVLRWAMTDVALFDGLAYDLSDQTDHFFIDYFRHYSEVGVQGGQFLGFVAFQRWIQSNRDLDPVLRYFDGLRRTEDRLRLDRLVVFHLLLIAFINTFGYETQYTPESKLVEVVAQVRRPRVLDNLIGWLPRHGLGDDPEAMYIAKAWRVAKVKSK